MYKLTALGTSTIEQLKVPHKQHFEKIWQLFENGNQQIIKDFEQEICKIISKYDTGRWTRTHFVDNVRSYILAPEYWVWEQ